MRRCGFTETTQRIERAAEFLDPRIRPRAHGLEHIGVPGILREVFEFIRIVLQVMEKLVIVVVKIAYIFEPLITQSLKGGDTAAHGEVFVIGFRPPPFRLTAFHHRLETVALVSFRNLHAGPIQKGRRKIQVQRRGIRHLSTLFGRHPRITNDQRYPQGILVVRPFAGKATVPHEESVVRRVDDDGVLREAGLFQSLEKPADGVVNAADHAQVGAHVGAIFFIGIPTPEKTLARDGCLQKIRLTIENLRIIQARRCDVIALIQSIHRARPWEMPDARAPVAVLGVTGIKPHVHRERLPLRLVLDELYAVIDDHLGLMPQRTVRLGFVKRIAAHRLIHVKMISRLESARHLGVPFTEESGAIAIGSQEIRIQLPHRLRRGTVRVGRRTKGSSHQPTENRSAAHPTNRLANMRVGKSRALLGQSIQMRRLRQWMPIASERAGGLVIGKKENNVRLRRRLSDRREAQRKG